MTDVANLSDVAQIINNVINLFLNIEIGGGIKLSYLIVVIIALACVFGLLVNDGD